MRNGFVASLVALLTGTSLAVAQPAPPVTPEVVPLDVIYETVIEGGPGRFWGSAEYLLFAIKDSQVPVLVSTGPASSAAILDRPGTFPLFGGSDVYNGFRSGGRFVLGYWFDDSQTFGVDASYLFLGSRAVDFGTSGNG